MRITKLRLLGFKSFVEPTELLIEPGLTGVVGPNGCGKSNLLEALRWVMGEQSYKSMRASSMDDVIFAGTQGRPARNSAEVTVTLDNSERKAPAEFNDSDRIEITRRIEREQGSSYRVNGREVRARDVKLLFEDAATGARSHALVRQGQIGEIVNAKPEKRRRVLEDAAGVAGLHSRRHEAELRLRAAEANLARIDDVVGQLESQMNSLKRQARQAKRYKELSDELRRAEAIHLHLGWCEANARVEAEEAALREVIRRVAEATAAESEASRARDEAEEALKPLRADETRRAAALERLRAELVALEKRGEAAEARRAELAEQRAEIERDLERERALIAEAQEVSAQLTREHAELSKRLAASDEQELAARKERERLASALEEAERALGELTRVLAEREAEERRLERHIAEHEALIERLEAQSAEVARDREALARLAPAATRLEALSETRAHLEAELGELSGQLEAAETARSEAEAQEKAARDKLAERRLALSRLEAEVETLTRLFRRNNNESSDSDVSHDSDDWLALIDQIEVAPGYEAALGAVLGDDLEAPTDAAAPAHWREIGICEGEPALPAGVEPLARHVRAPAVLARRLNQIGLVADGQGAALQGRLMPGQCLVSRDGALWRWDGFVAGSEAQSTATARLAARNRLTEPEGQLAECRKAVAEAEEQERTARGALEARRSEEQALKREVRDRQTRLGAAQAALLELQEEARAANEKLAALNEAASRIASERTRALEALEQARTERAHLAPLAELQAHHGAARERAGELGAELRAAEGALQTIIHERTRAKERLGEIDNEARRWAARKESAEKQAAELTQRLDKLGAEAERLADMPSLLAAEGEKLRSALKSAEEARRVAGDQLAQGEAELKRRQTTLTEARARLAEAREARARIEAQLEAARGRQADQARRIRETLGCAPDACLEVAGLHDAEGGERPSLPTLAEIERRIERLKADRERLGGVNLRAEEELASLAESFESTSAEKADLEAAIARLRQGIGKLNAEGRRRLLAAFDEVNGHFKRLFTTLFGGGTAELKLVESDDPLEAGLELIARPPGKKPQVLSLLSGGEQALTAMALIFAVFLTNPSPICVLDEVDAPLDEANVDRFCTLLEEMAASTDTRFLIITHHPLTMARVDRLFGVTMAERGVSQLVSVDLATAERLREAS